MYKNSSNRVRWVEEHRVVSGPENAPFNARRCTRPTVPRREKIPEIRVEKIRPLRRLGNGENAEGPAPYPNKRISAHAQLRSPNIFRLPPPLFPPFHPLTRWLIGRRIITRVIPVIQSLFIWLGSESINQLVISGSAMRLKRFNRETFCGVQWLLLHRGN